MNLLLFRLGSLLPHTLLPCSARELWAGEWLVTSVKPLSSLSLLSHAPFPPPGTAPPGSESQSLECSMNTGSHFRQVLTVQAPLQQRHLHFKKLLAAIDTSLWPVVMNPCICEPQACVLPRAFTECLLTAERTGAFLLFYAASSLQQT